MTFADKLQKKSDKAFQDWIDNFVEDLKPQLEESAKEGYKGFRITNVFSSTGRDDVHFMKNNNLLGELEKRLDGCTAILDRKEYKLLFSEMTRTKVDLMIRWGEKSE